MNMITLYQSATAVCAIKVRLVLSEKELAWTAENLDLRAGDQHKPAYLGINPAGVVPTIVHDGRILTESSVIMQYLDELSDKHPLQPADPYDRARMRLWLKRVDEHLHPGNITLTYATLHRAQVLALAQPDREAHFARIPDAERRARQRRAIELGLRSDDAVAAIRAFSAAIHDLEEAFTDASWVAGNDFSLADAALTPYMDRLEALGLSILWKDAPKVGNWLERLRARRSYEEAVTRMVPPRKAGAAAIGEDELERLLKVSVAA